MQRTISVLFFATLCSLSAFGQGVRFDIPPILNSRGVPIANPNISLCTGLATINGTTCSIQAQSVTDITTNTLCPGGSPVTLTNSNVCRATGDALGNAGFWLSPGAYIYCVTAPSTTGQCYNLTAPVGVTAASAIPSLTIANAGIYTNTQQNESATSSLNGLNFGTVFSGAFVGLGFATDALAGGVAVPVTSTVLQADGIAGYTTNASATTNAVGVFGLSTCNVTNGKCWGGNTVAVGTAGKPAATLFAFEGDVNAFNAGDNVVAVMGNGLWSAQPTASTGFFLQKPGAAVGGPYFWDAGILIQTGSTVTPPDSGHGGIILNPAASGSTQKSQAIVFNDTDSGAVTHTTTLQMDALGNFILSASGGGDFLGNNFGVSDTAGRVNVYQGLLTAGTGLAPNLGTVLNLTGQTGNLGATTIYTTAASVPGAAGLYRVCVTTWTTATGNTTALQANIVANNGAGASTTPAGPVLSTSALTNAAGGACVPVHVAVSQAIQVSTTGYNTTGTYSIQATVEQLF